MEGFSELNSLPKKPGHKSNHSLFDLRIQPKNH